MKYTPVARRCPRCDKPFFWTEKSQAAFYRFHGADSPIQPLCGSCKLSGVSCAGFHRNPKPLTGGGLCKARHGVIIGRGSNGRYQPVRKIEDLADDLDKREPCVFCRTNNPETIFVCSGLCRPCATGKEARRRNWRTA